MSRIASPTLRVWVLIAVVLAPGALFADQHEVRILLDLDDDTATACSVPTVDGPFAGVEQILVTTVETTSPPATGAVTDVAVSECVDPTTDTFSAPASFDGGWPVGIDQGEGGLAGTPGAGDLGTYALTFTADNGAGAPVVQNFTLSVILASYADLIIASGHEFMIGIGAIGANLYAFTYSEVFTLPLSATSGPFTKERLGPPQVGVRTNQWSWAVPNPTDLNFVFYTGGTGAVPSLYSYRLSPEGQTSVPILQLSGGHRRSRG